MFSTKIPLNTQSKAHAETVEEFLARGGQIDRIEAHPDPEGRVLLRGWRQNPFGQPLRPNTSEAHRR
jgi:hypothetical protein